MDRITQINNLYVLSTGINHIDKNQYKNIIDELNRLSVIEFIINNKFPLFNITKLTEYSDIMIKKLSKKIQEINPGVKFNF